MHTSRQGHPAIPGLWNYYTSKHDSSLSPLCSTWRLAYIIVRNTCEHSTLQVMAGIYGLDQDAKIIIQLLFIIRHREIFDIHQPELPAGSPAYRLSDKEHTL